MARARCGSASGPATPARSASTHDAASTRSASTCSRLGARRISSSSCAGPRTRCRAADRARASPSAGLASAAAPRPNQAMSMSPPHCSPAMPATRPVLLIHGIWNTRLWLLPLARRLRAAGLEVRLWGYPSVLGDPGRASQALVDRLAVGPAVDLAGYSLGGLVALEALRLAPELPVRRVVCLGSPLCGSCTARALCTRDWSSLVLGRSANLLRRGLDGWAGQAEVGVVAGCVPRGVGRLLSSVDTASDG